MLKDWKKFKNKKKEIGWRKKGVKPLIYDKSEWDSGKEPYNKGEIFVYKDGDSKGWIFMWGNRLSEFSSHRTKSNALKKSKSYMRTH